MVRKGIKVIITTQSTDSSAYSKGSSEKSSSMVYNEEMEKLRSQESVVSEQEKLSGQLSVVSGQEKLSSQLSVFSSQALFDKDYFEVFSTFDNEKHHGPNAGNDFGDNSSLTTHVSQPNSSSLIDTYYIYSFDGKLIAEYDHDGNCVKDYIYAGNRLIAEYQSQTGKYYYYMGDQINSTRIITDDNGNVVYSAAHRPFGQAKDVWTKTYDPKLKFSGKEREDYSDLDYFGARYYDHNSYRFISVDPIINKGEAFSNPQLWNLYAYCRNNPITYLDPDGRRIVIDPGQYHNEIQQAVNIGRVTPNGAALFDQLDSDPRTITLKGGILPVTTQNGRTTATCGQKTGHTIQNNFIESVEFTIDFNNITNYHSDPTGVNTVWHELFHASAYMQSNQQTGISWVQSVGIAWRQDQPVQGGQGTGTQRGTAGQFGAQVAQETVNMVNYIYDSIR